MSVATLTPEKINQVEKPNNGIGGLKHWRHDLIAGLVVSLVSVPFSSGIALASGVDPIYGIISAIIGGLVLSFIGGSYVTIGGPAAGLAPAIYSGMLMLGKGSLKAGYPLLLPVICLTGLAQIILCKFRAAKFSEVFSSSAIQGMLTAIGIMIIAKQIPLFIGHPYQAHEFWGIIFETPKEFLLMNQKVFAVGFITLILIFVFAAQTKKIKLLRAFPPQIIAVVIGTVLGVALKLNSRFLINIPKNPLSHGIMLPDFKSLFMDSSLWYSAVIIVLTLTLIDSTESLATIKAIDKIDPFRRKSDPDKTLFAVGVAKICSSMIGGLTIIPGGVKSSTCIMAGGRTQWANFYNACFLLLYLFLFRDYINLIPLTVLSAVLIYTGYKLCRPGIWYQVARIGMEQLIVFSFTVFLTLTTDLLWGICGGILLELLITTVFIFSIERKRLQMANGNGLHNPLQILKRQFQNPVKKNEMIKGEYHLYFDKPLVCFNSLHLNRELSKIPAEAKCAYLHLTKGVTLIDHTTCESLLGLIEQNNLEGKTTINIVGMECMKSCSSYPSSMRLVDLEQEEAMSLI